MRSSNAFSTRTRGRVQKLNLSAQPGTFDEDISVTHKRTGIRLKVESKNAKRGSMTCGARCRIVKVPHFEVKCHRSRSNMKLAGTSNDRYAQNVFDVIITNPLNALYVGGTIGEDFEIVQDENLDKVLSELYGTSNQDYMLNAASNDWRFVFPPDIAENSFVPRNPRVQLKDDPNWLPIENIEGKLLEIVKARVKSKGKRRSVIQNKNFFAFVPFALPSDVVFLVVRTVNAVIPFLILYLSCPLVKFADLQAIIIGKKEFCALRIPFETISQPEMILPTKYTGVEFILIRIEIRWVYKKERSIGGIVYGLFKVLAEQFHTSKFLR